MNNYKQYNYNATYSGGSFASQACGPTSVADIVDVSPLETAAWLTNNGYATDGHGTEWSGIAPCLSAYNANGKQLNSGNLYGTQNSDAETAWKAAVQSGYCGILLMGGPSYWTGSGHFIACVGYDNGRYQIYDPASSARDGWHEWSDFAGLVKVFYISSKAWGQTTTSKQFNFNQVNPGSQGTSVLLVQEILKARGIYKGELDGSAGPQTIAAIEEYQKARGLAVDGRCGPTTFYDMTALGHVGCRYTVPQIRLGDKGEAVLLLQEILKARGIYAGELDQNFGPATEAALRKYQEMRHAAASLNIDGVCGPATWTDLLGM